MYASGLIPEFVGQVQTMTFYILPNECIWEMYIVHRTWENLKT
jgi:hypothetical protein